MPVGSCGARASSGMPLNKPGFGGTFLRHACRWTATGIASGLALLARGWCRLQLDQPKGGIMKLKKITAVVAAALLASAGMAMTVQAQEKAQEKAKAKAMKKAGGGDMTFFVTSAGTGKGADLGGLDRADAHCHELAKAAGSKHTSSKA